MRIRGLFVYTLFIALMMKPALAAAELIEVSVGEWPPYVSEYMRGNGMCAEIVAAAFNRIGVQTKLDFYPWTRTMLVLKKGGVAASFPWVKRKDREEFAYFSEVLHKQKSSFFYYKDAFKDLNIQTAKDVKDYVVGVPLGYSYLEILKKDGYRCKVITNSANGILMLMRGNIDFLYESVEVGRYNINTLLPGRKDEFGEVPIGVEDEGVYLIFPKSRVESEDLLIRFNAGLEAIKKSGEYDAIVRRYLQMD